MIPKIIHQTWKTTQVPDHWKESHERWKSIPGWEYKLWTDEDNRNLIKDNYPWFLEKFDSYKYGIQRADAIRYFILHKFGGVYCDLDLAPANDFNSFFESYSDNEVILSLNRPGNDAGSQNITNAIMMSKPGSQFWVQVWDLLNDPFKYNRWKSPLSKTHYFHILFTTGPGIISDAYHNWSENDKVVCIPGSILQPEIGSEDKVSKIKTLEGSSWHEGDAKFFKFLGEVKNHSEVILGVISGILFLVVLFLLIYK